MSKKKLVPRLRFKEFEKDGEWKKLRLDELVTIVDGDRGTNYPSKKDFTDNGHTLFLNASNVTKLGFKFEENQYISEIKSNLMGNGKLLLNDIILTSRGSIGNIAIYNEGINGKYPYVRINSGMLILRNRNIADSYFIGQYLKSPSGKYQIKLISFGSAQPQLTKNDVSNYSVVHPIDLSEQRRIGDFLNKFDAMIQLQQSKVNKVKDLKSAYLSEMFPKEGENHPKKRFEGFTDPWNEYNLGEVAQIKTGNTNVQDAVPNGKFTFFDRSTEIKRIDKYYYDEEAIIYPGEGSEFYPRYFNGKYALHQRAYSITSDVVNLEYLSNMMLLRNNHFVNNAVGSTVKSLRMENFTKCKIFVPSIEEQKKITRLFKYINLQILVEEEKLAKLEKLKQAYLNDMFV